jgi:hypothetical protein
MAIMLATLPTRVGLTLQRHAILPSSVMQAKKHHAVSDVSTCCKQRNTQSAKRNAQQKHTARVQWGP